MSTRRRDRCSRWSIIPKSGSTAPTGSNRPQTVNLSFVQSASQAQRLVKQRLQRAQYGGSFTGVFQATAWKFQKGDVIRFSFYPLGWDRKLFRIADMAIQVDGLVPMMLREEHPDIYAWGRERRAPVHAADPTVYDPTLWPIVQGILNAQAEIDLLASDGILSHGSEKAKAALDWRALTEQVTALHDRYVALDSPSDASAAIDEATARARCLDELSGRPGTRVGRSLDGHGHRCDDMATEMDRRAYAATATAAAAITGRPGRDGVSAYAILLTNESHILPAGADGAVTTYNGASTSVIVYSAGADVTSSFTLSVASNPQALTIGISGRTATVTGGLDPNEPNAIALLRMTGTGTYAGVVLDKQFSLTKSRAGADGTSPPLLTLSASSQIIRRTAGEVLIAGQPDFVFAAQRRNLASGTTFSFVPSFPVNTPGVTVSGDTMTVTAARMADMIAYDEANPGNGGAAVKIVATAGGLSDTVTVVAVNNGADGKDGLDGDDGAPGAPGADGQRTYVHYAYANSDDGRVDFDINQPNGRAYEGSYTDTVAADSGDYMAYKWREYKGPPFGMAARGNAVVAGNQVVKNGGPQAWDSDAYFDGRFSRSCGCEFQIRSGKSCRGGTEHRPCCRSGHRYSGLCLACSE